MDGTGEYIRATEGEASLAVSMYRGRGTGEYISIRATEREASVAQLQSRCTVDVYRAILYPCHSSGSPLVTLPAARGRVNQCPICDQLRHANHVSSADTRPFRWTGGGGGGGKARGHCREKQETHDTRHTPLMCIEGLITVCVPD